MKVKARLCGGIVGMILAGVFSLLSMANAQTTAPAPSVSNDAQLCLGEDQKPGDIVVPCTRLLETVYGAERIPFLLARGRAYAAQNQHESAEKDFAQALELDQRNVQALYERGAFYAAQEKYEAALGDLNRLLALDPKDADGLYSRAFLYALLEKDKEAIADLTQLLAIHSEDAQSYNDRGGLYLRSGNLKAAIADYDKAIALAKNFNEAIYNRGRAYLLLGKNKKAAADFRRVLKLRPHNPYAALRLALAGDDNELKPALKELGKDRWPAALLRYYLGEITAEEIFSAIKRLDKNQASIETEAAYYIGSRLLKEGDKEKASAVLNRAARSPAKSVIEFYDIQLMTKAP